MTVRKAALTEKKCVAKGPFTYLLLMTRVKNISPT